MADFGGPDLEAFRAEAREWLEANFPKSLGQDVAAQAAALMSPEKPTGDLALWKERMGQKGWGVPTWPKAYGGGGLSSAEARVLAQEMAKIGAVNPIGGMGVGMFGPTLLEYGTEEQKQKYIPDIATGTIRWCQGFSEPNAGSDLASLKTSARRVSDEQGEAYIVNGGKIWTSDGDKADWMYALVRTDNSSKKQEGISFLLIDMKAPGVTVKPIELISGKSSFCQVFFDDVRVPVRQLVGKEGEGWALGKKLLQHERAAMSKFTEGGAPSHDALKTALPYMVDEQGKVNEPVLRDKLAGLLMDAQAFTLTHRRVTEKALARKDVSAPSSIMKLVQTEQEVAKYELLEQALGMRGLGWDAGEDFTADEIEVCRAWLRSKSYTIAGGSSEVQLNIIAKRVLELP